MLKNTWQIFSSIGRSAFGRLLLIVVLFFECRGSSPEKNNKLSPANQNNMNETTLANADTVTLGGGCFWCIEAVLLNLEGVYSVSSGYSGGKTKNPTYSEVCSGLTGHAEVVQVIYDTKKLSFAEILEVFFTMHDPTTLNRQGNDVGTQYRSVIFYNSPEQKQLTEKIISDLNKSGAYSNPIVTQVEELTVYYKAEAYHQNYFNNNPEQGYCQYVIQPKMDKFKKVFADKMKK